jgi:lipoprotein-anchoring transpeptidase ErfK/SrfK
MKHSISLTEDESHLTGTPVDGDDEVTPVSVGLVSSGKRFKEPELFSKHAAGVTAIDIATANIVSARIEIDGESPDAPEGESVDTPGGALVDTPDDNPGNASVEFIDSPDDMPDELIASSGDALSDEPDDAPGDASIEAQDDTPLVSRKTLTMVLGFLAVLLIAVYAGGVIYFADHFGFNTTVDGRNMTFLTVAQAEQRLKSNASRFELHVSGRENLQFVVRGSDVGMQYIPDGQLQDILANQNAFAWPLRVLPQLPVKTTPSLRFESIWLELYLAESDVFASENMRPPTDARPIFVNGVWQIQEQDMGTTLDEEAVLEIISTHLVSGQVDCDLDQANCYVNPTHYADDPDLLSDIEEYNAYVPFQIIYEFGDHTEVLDGSIAIQWFVDGPGGKKKLDLVAVDAWLDGFCRRHNTVGTQRVFMARRNEQLTVTGGSYGWQIDRSAERAAILGAIGSGTSEQREPYYRQRAAEIPSSSGMPDWGGTYIEIDQGVQKLSYFVDNVLVLETDIVTGLPTPMWTTPCGVYYVLTRVSPARLRGPIMENGEPMWDSTVQFWMGVTTGGVGIHDAYWQPWFGGTRYQYGGSHGCINLPYNAARDLFRAVEIGTPVVIHW